MFESSLAIFLFLYRETSRTTTTMAMSTARAEATLAVLEAERAQLEHRLKKVGDVLKSGRETSGMTGAAGSRKSQ